MRARMALLALAVCAAVAAAPATAGAQEPPTLTKVVKVTGKTKSGKKFRGKYVIDRFRASNGRVRSIGTIRGRLGDTRVVERGVRMPAKVSKPAAAAQLPDIPNSCEVLDLVLGPINLNLLGLVVRTNRINVRIDAVPGPGNLLGNLLCAITGLLDPQTASRPNLAAALNSILALVPRTG
jgi:hypothetical protein